MEQAQARHAEAEHANGALRRGGFMAGHSAEGVDLVAVEWALFVESPSD